MKPTATNLANFEFIKEVLEDYQREREDIEVTVVPDCEDRPEFAYITIETEEKTFDFGISCEWEMTRETVMAEVFKHLFAPSNEDWHLSPSQIEVLESKIREFVQASNNAGQTCDGDEVVENLLIGTLENEIGELNAK